MPNKPSLIKYLSKDQLEKAYKSEKNSRVKERVLAILLLYEGKKVPEAAALVRRGVSTIELWISNWNKKGIDGLKTHFTGGPKPKVSSAEWDKIVSEIEDKGMTIHDVLLYVKETRKVSYTYKWVWDVLRRKRHLRYGKPYKINEKRPEDADAILKKAIGGL